MGRIYLQERTTQVLLPYVCAAASKKASLTVNYPALCFDLKLCPQRELEEFI